MMNPLGRIHVVLHFSQLSHGELNHLDYRKDVRENQSSNAWIDAESACHHKNSDCEDEQRSNRIQANGQPTLIGIRQEVCAIH